MAAWAATRRARRGRRGRAGRPDAPGNSGCAPMPIRRNAVPSASRASMRAGRLEQQVGQPGRAVEAVRAGAQREVGGLQLQHHPAGGEILARAAGGRASPPAARAGAPGRRGSAMSVLEGGFGADRFRLAAPDRRARASSPRARRTRAGPSSPRRARAARSSSACRWPSLVMPIAVQPAGKRRADAGQQADRLGGEQCGRLGADHAEAARLVAAGGDLRQQPVGGQPDRDGDADLALDVAARSGRARRRAGRRAAPRCRRGRAPPRRSTAAAPAASAAPSARGSGG